MPSLGSPSPYYLFYQHISSLLFNKKMLLKDIIGYHFYIYNKIMERQEIFVRFDDKEFSMPFIHLSDRNSVLRLNHNFADINIFRSLRRDLSRSC